MIKKLLNNWGLKLGSIVMAAILWILVTNINDPLNTIRFSNIPVNLMRGRSMRSWTTQTSSAR